MGRRILLDSTWMSAMAAAAPPSFQRDGFEANQTRTTYDPPVRRRDKFNPTLAAVICALILSFFLVGFAARYFKHWILGDEDTPESSDFPGRRRLSTRPRKAVETGLDPEVLSALPLVQYADLVESGKCSEDCSVCLGVFQSSDSLRLLPECAHAFHSDCIDEWFKTHSTCPLCRASLAKSAVEGASAEDHGHGVEGDVEHDGARRPATNFDVIQVVISGESSAAAAAAAASLSGLSQGHASCCNRRGSRGISASTYSIIHPCHPKLCFACNESAHPAIELCRHKPPASTVCDRQRGHTTSRNELLRARHSQE